MRKAIFLSFIVLELFSFKSTAQDPSSLQIVGGNGGITLSWTNGYTFSLLQSTTNAALPMFWNTELTGPFQLTHLNLPIAYPQQLFRLAPLTPLFQYAIFYNLDLEISISVPETINSKVFCNGNIWLWPYAQVTFNDTVTASLSLLNQENPNNPESSNGYVPPVFSSPPVSGAAPLDLFARVIDSVSSNLFQTFLSLPPENYRAPNPNANLLAGQSYIYNQVDLIVSNSASGNNLTAFYQDLNNMSSPLTQISFDVTNQTFTTTNLFYSFATNVIFYDYRESNTVKAVQIDIGKFNTWLIHGGAIYNNQNINDKAHMIDSIYVYNDVPLTEATLPAVRVIDGATLPVGGLTIATPQPLYVLGNYNASASDLGTTNVADTVPAALMGDAITVLSANWKDIYSPNTFLTQRNPTSTTINAAILTGIVSSVTVNGVQHYSGSWENILRLLENWNLNTTTLTYNGSTVAAFPSQYATNYWQPTMNAGNNSGYYNIPARNWNFDPNFFDFTKLPPLTPFVANFVTP